jgi:hypothetical protein
MKRLFRVFELSKNEQRVVLIVVLVLIAIAFVRYERRVHRDPVQATPPTQSKAFPTATGPDDGKQTQFSLKPRICRPPPLLEPKIRF